MSLKGAVAPRSFSPRALSGWERLRSLGRLNVTRIGSFANGSLAFCTSETVTCSYSVSATEIAPKGTLLRGVDELLVLRRVGHPVDHEAVDRCLPGFELQAQLLLNRGEDSGADLRRCCAE